MRRLHKAFLRYHDPENWPVLREALKRMGRADLIGNGKQHLIPAYQPVGGMRAARAPAADAPFRTQHTGPAEVGQRPAGSAGQAAAAKAWTAGERNRLLGSPRCD